MKCLNKLFAFANRQSTTTTTNCANHQGLDQQYQLRLEQQPGQTSRKEQEERKQPREGSATLTSTLYAVTFVPNFKRTDSERSSGSSRIAILADGEPVELKYKQLGAKTGEERSPSSAASPSSGLASVATAARRRDGSGLVGYFMPAATIGSKTIATTSTSAPVSVTSADNTNRATIVGANQPRQPRPNSKQKSPYYEENDHHYYCCYHYDCDCDESVISVAAIIEDDWILVDSSTTAQQPQPKPETLGQRDSRKQSSSIVETEAASKLQLQAQIQQMALDSNSVELVKASWIPVRRDPVASGVLLFKGLFTKFPQYLKFFPQFVDLDLECLQENKRLLRHAVKVIETVTFVVDSIGDDTKGSQLEAALVSLVRGHLKRRIGLAEFRNLGIVLIDFICDINNRRGSSSITARRMSGQQLNKSSTSDSSNHSSYDSETMTSALDKIRASTSPSSSSEEDGGYLGSRVSGLGGGGGGGNIGPNVPNDSYAITRANRNSITLHDDENKLISNLASDREQRQQREASSSSEATDCNNESKVDTNLLVAAWTKMYSSILDLVKREEGNSND